MGGVNGDLYLTITPHLQEVCLALSFSREKDARYETYDSWRNTKGYLKKKMKISLTYTFILLNVFNSSLVTLQQGSVNSVS